MNLKRGTKSVVLIILINLTSLLGYTQTINVKQEWLYNVLYKSTQKDTLIATQDSIINQNNTTIKYQDSLIVNGVNRNLKLLEMNKVLSSYNTLLSEKSDLLEKSNAYLNIKVTEVQEEVKQGVKKLARRTKILLYSLGGNLVTIIVLVLI